MRAAGSVSGGFGVFHGAIAPESLRKTCLNGLESLETTIKVIKPVSRVQNHMEITTPTQKSLNTGRNPFLFVPSADFFKEKSFVLSAFVNDTVFHGGLGTLSLANMKSNIETRVGLSEL